MRLALGLARRGFGHTSPNPMVGAVLVKAGRIIGRGWHQHAGGPHAEIEALHDAERRGQNPKGSTLYVTLEPCSTQGRTPPCTEALIRSGIKKVVVGATDPNPRHSGRAFPLLRGAGIAVVEGVLSEECERLNEAFNHWIVHGTPLVTIKAAITLDGKIATASGESKWITSEPARAYAMKLRQGADAILVGINTVLADDPKLTVRMVESLKSKVQGPQPRRIVLDSRGRTPLGAKLVRDEHAALTTVIVSESAPKRRVAELARRVKVVVAPLVQSSKLPASSRPAAQVPRITHHASRTTRPASVDLRWVLRTLGSEDVTSLLVEGGGEVNASFLLRGLAQSVAFFYAPIILGGGDSRHAVGGDGARTLEEGLELTDPVWRRLGPDWLLSARVS